MKKFTYLYMSVVVATLVLGFTMKTTMAADTMPATTENVKVLLDNEQVRVTEADRPPGTKVALHTHPTFMAYYLSPAKVKLTSAAGKSTVKDIPAGKLIWFPKGVTHSLEVLGTTDQHVLVIELKK